MNKQHCQIKKGNDGNDKPYKTNPGFYLIHSKENRQTRQ